MSASTDSIVYWSIPSQKVIEQLGSSDQGLTASDANDRLKNRPGSRKKMDFRVLELFLAQFKSPLVLLLLFAALLSFFLQDHADSIIIMIIVCASGCLGFWQEWGADDAVKKLLSIVQTKVDVIRDGKVEAVAVDEVVVGDLVQLSAGDTIPADSLIVKSKDLFVDEAALTGETYPAEKYPGTLPVEISLSKRANSLFKGTHVISGTARAIAVRIGDDTEFGKVSQRLRRKAPETDFERGIAVFGYLLIKLTLSLVLPIFTINVFLKRPVLDSFMFSLALAVGLTPQLLPAIISVNLAGGARRMAKAKVIVKRLAAIESFGSMNVLCSDKTGTLTEGSVELHGAVNIAGKDDALVMLYAYLNSTLEVGFVNPIDQSIRKLHIENAEGYKKLDEIPYDFIRKRLSILVSKDNTKQIIAKGALKNILDVCTEAHTADGSLTDINSVRETIMNLMQGYSTKGCRVLGVAYKNVSNEQIKSADENSMILAGLLVFKDPPKEGIEHTIEELNNLGVALKIITGDNHMVAEAVAKQVGFKNPVIMTSQELNRLSSDALVAKVNAVDVFAEIEPNQKETIIVALKKAGKVVGYIGDGINDASALHAADVGISVNNAVDVAKEAAQLVMLEHDLAVLVKGIKEGRTTFANTLKYIFMATSANFGNMFSMAGASLFLTFLPLLPKQVLLTNLMTDFPEMTIVTDNVDAEAIECPGKWDMDFIRRFMVVFGIISSFFDYLTFASLLLVFKSGTEQFRTAWFTESVISACMIVLVVRTRRPFILSLPSRPLVIANLIVIGATLLLPYTPLCSCFGFAPIPPVILGAIAAIVGAYVVSAEVAKVFFYRH